MATHVIETLVGRTEVTPAPRIYSKKEIAAFKEAASRMEPNGYDVWTTDADKNWELLDAYFQAHRSTVVTVDTVFGVVNASPNSFFWCSSAKANWFRLAVTDPERATALATWLNTHGGKPGMLVNGENDQTYENLTLLFSELHGRDIDSQRVQEASGRIGFKPGKQLHYVPQPRKEHYGQHSANDDGKDFLDPSGMIKVRNARGEVIGLRSPNAQEQAAATAAANSTTPTPDLTKEEASWRSVAIQHCNFGFHSDQLRLKKICDSLREAGATWRQTAETLSKEVADLKKSRSLAR